MTKAARISLVVCFCLALYGVIFASPVVSQEPTVQEADFWLAAGCDELCLDQKSLDEANAKAEGDAMRRSPNRDHQAVEVRADD